jgi:hypothetical protein
LLFTINPLILTRFAHVNMSESEGHPPPTSDPLKETLRSAVAATNRALAQLEKTTRSIQAPVSSAWQQASVTGSTAAAYALDAYEHRHEYGPAGVIATSVVTGGIVSLRRGRFPGAVAAVLAGGAAYGVIYGLDDFDFDFGKRD